MKKITTFILWFIFLSPVLLSAQNADLNEEKKKINDQEITGFSSGVVFDRSFVDTNLTKELKKYGKITNVKESIIIKTANIPAVSSELIALYAQITASTNGTKIWIGSDKADEKLKDFVSGLIRYLYKTDIQLQIEEAEQAMMTINKNYEKKIKESDDLNKKIENNKLEKLKLEQNLQQNAINLKQLEADTEKNNQEKVVTLQELEKIKKILEQRKEKLVNFKE